MKIKFILLMLFMFSFSNSSFAWYDSNAVGTAPDWTYRVPINIPAGAVVNSTIKFDVDFNALLSSLSASGTFDINSPRIVRPSEALAATQEFTDRIYNDVLDVASNGRGEVKFILQDAGPATYYLYFDTTVNGPKPANAQATINGNFEHSTGSTPSQWLVSDVNANGNQNNEVHTSTFGSTYTQASATTCPDQVISNADNSPNNSGSAANTTGTQWHLLGYRDNCEDGSNVSEEIQLSKTITVPSSNPGNLTFYFQLQGFDDWNGTTAYDHFNVMVNNALVDHTALSIANGDGVLTVSNTGFGRNGGFSAIIIDAGWRQATLNLSPYVGNTITVKFTADFFTDNGYRTWIKLDDVEWSVVNATLGVAEVQPPSISLQKTSMIISDGVSASNPKRIPGAIVEYTLTVVNSGAGNSTDNTIVVNDAIPINTDYIVNSLSFVDGSPVSGLSTSPVPPATSILSYSSDGGINYNTTQSAAVTHIRVHPSGEFQGTSPSGNPNFQIIFRVQLQ